MSPSEPQAERSARNRPTWVGRARQRGGSLLNRLVAPYQDRLLRGAGLTPFGEYDAQDVFLVSYPKSGSTWLRSLLIGAAFGSDPLLTPFELFRKLMPFVGGGSHYARFSTPMYFKSHALPQPEYRRAIYLVRDGRDALVSFHHHVQTMRQQQIDIEDFVRGKDRYFKHEWHEHVEAWLGNPYGADILTLKYEDLKADPLDQLRRVCAFLGIARGDDLLRRVVDGSTFDKMRSKEQSDGPAIANWPAGQPFMRRGQTGSYRDELPEAALSLFMERAEPTLRKCGYL